MTAQVIDLNGASKGRHICNYKGFKLETRRNPTQGKPRRCVTTIYCSSGRLMAKVAGEYYENALHNALFKVDEMAPDE